MQMKLQSTTHVVMDSIVLEGPSSSTVCGGSGGGSRAIDRHNPIIRDEKRLGQGRNFPSHSTTTAATTDQPHLWNQKPEVVEGGDQKRKSVACANDDEFLNTSDFISPPSSSRSLLNNIATSEFRHVMPPSLSPPPPSPPREHVDINEGKGNFMKKEHDLLPSPPPTPQPSLPPSQSSPPPSPPRPPPSSNQVVVLEVALHCRGCERKMKKHLSKIEGVTSFKIEFAAKKVTVVGDVTPLAVLTSVLKVKNAKLLTPAVLASSSLPPPAKTGSNGS